VTFFAALDLLAAVAIGLAVTGLSWLLVSRLAPIDAPGARRTHITPTPRAGGLGIAVVALVVAWQFPGYALWLIPALGFVGLLDDFFPQPAALRLTLQILLCTIAVMELGDVWPEGPVFFLRLAMVLIAVWLVNAANFFDGRNGLLAGNFVLLLLTLPAIFIEWRFAVVFAGLWLGFIPFNFPHARLFMGDVGSYLIGGAMAWLYLQAAQGSLAQALAVLVAMSAILIDTSLTLLLRALAGKRVWRAHREHLYQWLARAGYSDVKLLAAYLVYAAISIWAARTVAMQNSHYAVIYTVIWGLASAFAWLQLRMQLLRWVRARR
jgi:UDP-N-acetylmuramyl pentapeptide phosphotransferase/UDP-N-acetylglucosamine-1-phosphate transferase